MWLHIMLTYKHSEILNRWFQYIVQAMSLPDHYHHFQMFFVPLMLHKIEIKKLNLKYKENRNDGR